MKANRGVDVDRVLSALADAKRRGVVDLLCSGPRSAGELADALALSRPAMSRHLRVLRHTGLVTEEHPEEDARVRIYRLRAEPFGALRKWLDEVELFWSGELEALKEYAERGARASRKVGRKAGRKR